ncbi:SM-like, degradation of cytoplasmic mRNAs and positively regulates transcription initiation, partial [Mortierella sp. GBA35]
MDSFQIFTTSTSLVDSVDTNLVLQDTIERIYVADTYGDIPRGIFIIRGENVVLLGEI